MRARSGSSAPSFLGCTAAASASATRRFSCCLHRDTRCPAFLAAVGSTIPNLTESKISKEPKRPVSALQPRSGRRIPPVISCASSVLKRRFAKCTMCLGNSFGNPNPQNPPDRGRFAPEALLAAQLRGKRSEVTTCQTGLLRAVKS